MCDEKRKRSPNWLPSEKILLLDLVQKHFKVVENKKTDGASIKAKLAEWKIISVEYNSRTTNYHRTAENLKSQWESMKKAAKKEASRARMRRIQTGGRPPFAKRIDPLYLRILSLIRTSAVGLKKPPDEDSVTTDTDSERVTTTGSDSQYIPGSCNLYIKQKNDTNQPRPVTVEDMNNEHDYDGPTTVELEDWGENNPDIIFLTPLSTELHSNEDVTLNTCETQAHQLVEKDQSGYRHQLLKTSVSAQLNKGVKNNKGISKRKLLHTSVMTSIELLHKQKIEAINLQKVLAKEKSKRNKTISELDIEIKREILKQEKLKTKMLLLELRQKRNNNYKFQKI